MSLATPIRSCSQQWLVESESSARKYTVTKLWETDALDTVLNTRYQCSCVGWTRHMPRRDCKHIRWVVAYGPAPVDALLMAMLKTERKALLADMKAGRP